MSTPNAGDQTDAVFVEILKAFVNVPTTEYYKISITFTEITSNKFLWNRNQWSFESQVLRDFAQSSLRF